MRLLLYPGLKRSGAALLCCLALTLTTSCAHQNGASQTDTTACLSFEPIYLGEADIAAISDGLARKLAGHNLAWEDLCDA